MNAKQIVVAYDASPAAHKALRWALGEADIRRLPVLVVMTGYAASLGMRGYVTYVDPGLDDVRIFAEDQLQRAASEAKVSHPGVTVETRFVAGNPAPILLELLEDVADSVEMVVMGSRGLGGFNELTLGSTSLQVAAHASCPVIVVRDGGDNARKGVGPEAGRVVVGVDGSDVSTQAVAFAFEEASFRHAGLTAVHAWNAPFLELPGKGAPVPASVLDDAVVGEELRALAESLAGWRDKYPDVDVRQVVVRGEPVPRLVEASLGAALLVVGTRGRGGFRSLVLGSVSHGVLHHAHVPVAVVSHRG